jgi:2-polyprenyl-6-methoxyphenol hydroxylase-like FAD-dependent oxidoreductase
MATERTEVLIVGAGPTGLALAVSLQQAGIAHLVIDRLDAGQNTSRAGVIHAHTLEVLDRIGVAEEMVQKGLILPYFSIRNRGRRLLRLSFAGLDAAWKGLLMIPQNVTEAVLERRLETLGGKVRRGVTATGLVQDADGVTVTLDTATGPQTIRAAYVVGGDGLHSVVRQAAGIAFEGESYPASFVLADVRMDWPPGAGEVSISFGRDGLVVVAPLPGDIFRVVATLDTAPETPGLADIQAILDARGPQTRKARVHQVLWSSRFRVQHRIAANYRAGRMFLMGDAAHVHSPAGGQGMNCGLVDADVLGQLLAEVIQGRHDVAALDDYERLRRPAALDVLALAERLTRMATLRGVIGPVLRNAAFRMVGWLPPLRRRAIASLSGLARRKYARLAPPARPALPQVKPAYSPG